MESEDLMSNKFLGAVAVAPSLVTTAALDYLPKFPSLI